MGGIIRSTPRRLAEDGDGKETGTRWLQEMWKYHTKSYGGFLKWGYPKNGWFRREHPNLKWMTGGSPIYGKPHMEPGKYHMGYFMGN